MEVTNPLDQLRENVQPEVVGWWPPSVGWWFLAGIAVCGLLFLFWVSVVFWWKNRYRRKALKKAKIIRATYANKEREHQLVHEFNHLLKQVALHAYPNRNVPRLFGDPWLKFLADAAKMPEFLVEQGHALGDHRFQSEITVDATALYRLILNWIKKHHV